MRSVRWAPVATAFFLREGASVRLEWLNDALDSLLGANQLEPEGLTEFVSSPEPVQRGDLTLSGSSTDPGSEPIAATVTYQPQTEDTRSAAVFCDTRRDAEVTRAIQGAEIRFESLLNGLEECIWVVREGRIGYANAAALNLLRLSWVKLDNSPYLELVHADDRPQVGNWLARVLAGHHLPPFECRLCQPDGHTRLIELSGVILSAEEQSIIACGRDVTERKRSEASLLQADRLASLGMLAGGMAHSLNNPLTYVLLNLDHLAKKLPMLAGDKSQISDALARLTEAREGAERMANIVKRMRNLARTDDSEIRAIDLGTVLESVVEIVANEMHHRGRLNICLSSVPPVVANESRVEQVFLGLVLFAARMLPEDTAKTNEVRLALYSNDQHAVVEIVCEGAHLDSNQLSSLFEPFAPSDEARTAGFGLSVCSSIVEQLGGQIGATSIPGTGLSLRVTLPCSKPSYSTEPPPPSTQQSSNPPVTEGGSARILVIDDDPGVGRALRLMLEDEHDVTSFTSPREALRKLLQDPGFDLIFCDLMMPELTGMDIFQVLRFNRPGYESRVVFMTGGAFTAAAKRFLAQVPNARIEKPFNLKALQRMVQHSIAKRAT